MKEADNAGKGDAFNDGQNEEFLETKKTGEKELLVRFAGKVLLKPL